MRATIASLLAAAILTGCTKSGEGTAGRHSWTRAGVLRVAVNEEPKNLNPLLAGTTIEIFIDRLMFEPLVSADDRGNSVPMLAARVPTLANRGVSADGLTITYHLRPDARWSDGAPVTAHDVVWTWQAIENPNDDVVSRHGYDDVRSIGEPDAHTAVVHLKRPFAPFVNTFFAESDQPYAVLPAHILARYPDINRIPFNAKPTVSDGPFLFEQWQHGDRVTFVGNPAFFQGAPKLHRVEVNFIANDDTAVNLLRTHAVDYIVQPSIQLYPLLRSIPQTRIAWVNPNGYEGMELNLSHEPISDPLVRRAIAAAIDKAGMAAKLTFGQAHVATGDIPDWMWAFDPALRSVPFDPALSQRLLRQAGWIPGPDGIVRKAGRPMQLLLAADNQSATHRSEILLVQAALHRVGIDVVVKSYPLDLLYAPQGMGGIQHGGKFDLLLLGWYAGVDPDNSSQFTCSNVPPHGYNDSRYCSAAMDAAQAQALAHYDLPTRKAAYSQIERLLLEDSPALFFWWQRTPDAVSDDFHGFDPNPTVDSWNAWLWSI